MFFTCLILLQCLKVLMEAEERKFESLASLDGIGDGRATDNESMRLDAVQVFQLLEFAHELLFVFCRHFGTKFEHH